MKKALCVVLVALVVGLAGMPVEAKPQPAFRDLIWGMSSEVLGEQRKEISAFPGLDPYSRRFFVKTNEDLRLGSITVKSIVYAFWEDQLSDILIFTEDATDALDLQWLTWRAWEPYIAVSWRKPIVDDEIKRVYYIPQTDTYYVAYKQEGLLGLNGAKMNDQITKNTPPPF